MAWFRTLQLALSRGSSSVHAAGPRCVLWPWPRVRFLWCQTSLPFLVPPLLPRERKTTKAAAAMGGRVSDGRLILPLFPRVCGWLCFLPSVLSMTPKLLQAQRTQHEGDV